MTAELRQLLRINLARHAATASGIGLTVDAFQIGVRIAGTVATREEIEANIDYLVDKKILQKVPQTISPEITRHRISADGRDWIAEQGF